MNAAPLPAPGRYLLLVTPYVTGESIFELTARLALQGALRVVDGGNTFNAYRVVEAARRNGADPLRLREALARTQLARAFTCYQMAAVLADLPQDPAPLLVLDFLCTFGDQNVALRERRRLLAECMAQIERLSHGGPVGVWVRARSVAPVELEDFLARLERRAGRTWRLEKNDGGSPRQMELY